MTTAACLLYTPGLDSRLSSWYLTRKKIPFFKCYVDINSRYSAIEKHLLKEWRNKNIIYVKGPDLSSLEDDLDAYIPNRNLLVATVAQSFTNCSTIYFSSVKDDRVPDSSLEFRESLSTCLSLSVTKKIYVDSVLYSKNKADWVKYYAKVNPKSKITLLTRTYSCFSSFLSKNFIHYYYRRNGKLVKSSLTYPVLGCRSCKACFRRFCALTAANIYVPLLDEDIYSYYYNEVVNNENNRRKMILRSKSRYNTIVDYLNTFYCTNKIDNNVNEVNYEDDE